MSAIPAALSQRERAILHVIRRFEAKGRSFPYDAHASIFRSVAKKAGLITENASSLGSDVVPPKMGVDDMPQEVEMALHASRENGVVAPTIEGVSLAPAKEDSRELDPEGIHPDLHALPTAPRLNEIEAGVTTESPSVQHVSVSGAASQAGTLGLDTPSMGGGLPYNPSSYVAGYSGIEASASSSYPSYSNSRVRGPTGAMIVNPIADGAQTEAGDGLGVQAANLPPSADSLENPLGTPELDRLEPQDVGSAFFSRLSQHVSIPPPRIISPGQQLIDSISSKTNNANTLSLKKAQDCLKRFRAAKNALEQSICVLEALYFLVHVPRAFPRTFQKEKIVTGLMDQVGLNAGTRAYNHFMTPYPPNRYLSLVSSAGLAYENQTVLGRIQARLEPDSTMEAVLNTGVFYKMAEVNELQVTVNSVAPSPEAVKVYKRIFALMNSATTRDRLQRMSDHIAAATPFAMAQKWISHVVPYLASLNGGFAVGHFASGTLVPILRSLFTSWGMQNNGVASPNNLIISKMIGTQLGATVGAAVFGAPGSQGFTYGNSLGRNANRNLQYAGGAIFRNITNLDSILKEHVGSQDGSDFMNSNMLHYLALLAYHSPSPELRAIHTWTGSEEAYRSVYPGFFPSVELFVKYYTGYVVDGSVGVALNFSQSGAPGSDASSRLLGVEIPWALDAAGNVKTVDLRKRESAHPWKATPNETFDANNAFYMPYGFETFEERDKTLAEVRQYYLQTAGIDVTKDARRGPGTYASDGFNYVHFSLNLRTLEDSRAVPEIVDGQPATSGSASTDEIAGVGNNSGGNVRMQQFDPLGNIDAESIEKALAREQEQQLALAKKYYDGTSESVDPRLTMRGEKPVQKRDHPLFQLDGNRRYLGDPISNPLYRERVQRLNQNLLEARELEEDELMASQQPPARNSGGFLSEAFSMSLAATKLNRLSHFRPPRVKYDLQSSERSIERSRALHPDSRSVQTLTQNAKPPRDRDFSKELPSIIHMQKVFWGREERAHAPAGAVDKLIYFGRPQ